MRILLVSCEHNMVKLI